MTTKPRAGLLPLYLKLCDEVLGDARRIIEPFNERVATGLRSQGIEVALAPICRLATEFRSAIDQTAFADFTGVASAIIG